MSERNSRDEARENVYCLTRVLDAKLKDEAVTKAATQALLANIALLEPEKLCSGGTGAVIPTS